MTAEGNVRQVKRDRSDVQKRRERLRQLLDSAEVAEEKVWEASNDSPYFAPNPPTFSTRQWATTTGLCFLCRYPSECEVVLCSTLSCMVHELCLVHERRRPRIAETMPVMTSAAFITTVNLEFAAIGDTVRAGGFDSVSCFFQIA